MQTETYRIRLAQPHELSRLQEVERSAARLYLQTNYAALADSAPLPIETLIARQRDGMIWVAADSGDNLVGFAVALILDGAVHLHELSVAVEHGRKGLGTKLIQAVQQWAKSAKYERMTLSTFRDIPWNAPYYHSLGFRVIAEVELTPGLRRLRAEESAAGLSINERVCMILNL